MTACIWFYWWVYLRVTLCLFTTSIWRRQTLIRRCVYQLQDVLVFSCDMPRDSLLVPAPWQQQCIAWLLPFIDRFTTWTLRLSWCWMLDWRSRKPGLKVRELPHLAAGPSWDYNWEYIQWQILAMKYLAIIKIITNCKLTVSDIVNLDLKSTLRILYNVFTKYKGVNWNYSVTYSCLEASLSAERQRQRFASMLMNLRNVHETFSVIC